MKNYFCTLFDYRYIDRGLALYESIDRVCDSFLVLILCLDDQTYNFIGSLNLRSAILIKISELEDSDQSLKRIKPSRSLVEYYFTCKSSLVLFIFKKYSIVDHLVYVDADMFFFSSPLNFYNNVTGKSVGVTPHRFSAEIKHLEKYGKYNAGFLFFKKDENGMSCLRWWNERCIDWCYDKIDNDRYADQKYIDNFSVLFDGVYVVDNIGVNLAPWNIEGKAISSINNKLYIDQELLICYHFHNLKNVINNIFDTGCKKYISSINRKNIYKIYKPYLSVLKGQRANVTINRPLIRGNINKNGKRDTVSTTLLEKINFIITVARELKKGTFVIG